ncbi:hypothetical protein G6F68_010695 [Rhizopus microsporus]|nr:hypothetical protein G6F68_010695 [Rhizopus microsporus]
MVTTDLEQDESRAPHLHRGRQQHGGKQQAADARRLRVEPVADPAGVLPAQPDREPEHQGLQHAGQIKVVQQVVAELGDRKHVDQVEEQFFVGHAGMVAIAMAQRGQAQSGAHGGSSACQAPVQQARQQCRHGEHQQQDRQFLAHAVAGRADPYPHVGHRDQQPGGDERDQRGRQLRAAHAPEPAEQQEHAQQQDASAAANNQWLPGHGKRERFPLVLRHRAGMPSLQPPLAPVAGPDVPAALASPTCTAAGVFAGAPLRGTGGLPAPPLPLARTGPRGGARRLRAPAGAPAAARCTAADRAAAPDRA